MSFALVDRHRLTSDLDALAAFTEEGSLPITRVVFSPSDMRARGWLRGQCLDAGLVIREDAVGNIFARWTGSDKALSPVVTGSHIDAIPNSGRYDGTVGVLGGLEAIRALQKARFVPRRSIELLMFTSEEPTRFGLGCLGSRLLSRSLDPVKADEMRDANDHSLLFLRKRGGYSGSLESVALPEKFFHSFVELHIEQGPILEREALDIGVVESIAAPATLRVAIEGEGGHAGSVLMRGRQDALMGAAELALTVEKAALTSGSPDSVGTAGLLNILPNLVNSIPREAAMEIDVRDTDLQRRDGMLDQIQAAAAEIRERRRLRLRVNVLNADAPAKCDDGMVSAVEEACREVGATHRRMVSRAYHDSLLMARVCPVAMIFIPCRNGYSHRPDEYAAPEAIEKGVSVLAETLRQLAF